MKAQCIIIFDIGLYIRTIHREYICGHICQIYIKYTPLTDCNRRFPVANVIRTSHRTERHVCTFSCTCNQLKTYDICITSHKPQIMTNLIISVYQIPTYKRKWSHPFILNPRLFILISTTKSTFSFAADNHAPFTPSNIEVHCALYNNFIMDKIHRP